MTTAVATVATVEERVARGVKWLDKYGPEDWRNKVTLDDFNIRATCSCVLGKVFLDKAANDGYGNNGFDWALDHYRGSAGSIVVCRKPARYGFDAYFNQEDPDRWDNLEADYVALQTEWERVLAA